MNPRTTLFFVLIFAISAGSILAASSPALWIDVPFVAQTQDGCGSAAISMVMQYWERNLRHAVPDLADPERIQSALYSRTAHGISSAGMEEYFRTAGYRAYAFRGDWNDLSHNVEAGRPLIVSLKASGPLGPLHYVVVVGIDDVRGFLYINDPAQQKNLRISREGLESEWNSTHHWTLLALPQSGD